MDHWIHMIACFVIVMGAVLRMNEMHWRTTPAVEMAAWWSVAVGAFSQFLWVDFTPGWPDALLTSGGALLVVLYTQPQWRRWFAERRVEQFRSAARSNERRHS